MTLEEIIKHDRKQLNKALENHNHQMVELLTQITIEDERKLELWTH